MIIVAFVSQSLIPTLSFHGRIHQRRQHRLTAKPSTTWTPPLAPRRRSLRMCSADSSSAVPPQPSSQDTPSSSENPHHHHESPSQPTHQDQQQQPQLQFQHQPASSQPQQQHQDATVETNGNPLTVSEGAATRRTQVQLLHDSPGFDYPDMSPGAVRPAWAPAWLPNFFLELPRRPLLQLALLLPLYAVHLFIFSTKGFKLPRPLIPNDKKLLQSIGWDSVVGAVVALVFLIWRKFFIKADKVIPRLLHSENPPWYVPREAKRKIGQTTAFLIVAYLASGYGAVFIEGVLFLLASYGVPLTIATTRAWKVLLGHLMWVYMGIRILRRLTPFFPKDGTWLRWKIKSNWLWWAIGGYYVSALIFNIADVINQFVLPSSLFEEETVVSKLINPENKDRVAMAIGSIGPCVSAPVFEEVLYRGFLLPALACFLPMWAAIPASSVLFALHHLNPTGVLPLTVLGLVWAILYTKSRNLTVTILIHCMWNSRVFLGSLLGLGTFTDFE